MSGPQAQKNQEKGTNMVLGAEMVEVTLHPLSMTATKTSDRGDVKIMCAYYFLTMNTCAFNLQACLS